LWNQLNWPNADCRVLNASKSGRHQQRLGRQKQRSGRQKPASRRQKKH
jgi:hypothetical protein